MAFTYRGLPTLRDETGGSSPDKRPVARGHFHPAFSNSQANDRGDVAQRLCGRVFCAAPVARGIGRLDFGAQGCFKHVVLDADGLGLHPLRRGVKTGWLPTRPVLYFIGGIFCLWTDVKTDGGHPAVCVVTAGLLAAAK